MIFDNKSILVTGGTGSLGRTLVSRILSGEAGHPRKVIVMSRDEAKQHDMRLDYLQRQVATDEVIYAGPKGALEFRIGDVRSYADICANIRDADYVVHAAALKQVPTAEYFPAQAMLTNCTGAANIVQAIQDHGYPVEAVLAVSTDKACKPINVMGMTKAIQERIFVAANVSIPTTRFVAVRYGNVLASRGSVIPLFIEQIRRGGPITITEPQMTRFLISLEAAVDTILAALREARPGEIYVPPAPAATIVTIARALIARRPIEIKEIGARPGEKSHEILVSEEEARRTCRRGNYYVIRPMLPELRTGQDTIDASSDSGIIGELSSADGNLSVNETRSLLARHGLLVDDPGPSIAKELLG
jgi:UDP-glucose 4-epimerase